YQDQLLAAAHRVAWRPQRARLLHRTARGDADLGRRLERQHRRAFDPAPTALWRALAIGDPQRVGVPDLTTGHFALPRLAAAQHVQNQRRALADADAPADQQRDQQQRNDNNARPDHAARLSFERILRRMQDQAARIADAVHYRVAGIDTGGARNALVLQAV